MAPVLWPDPLRAPTLGNHSHRQHVGNRTATVMRYFFILGQTGGEANAPLDEVRKCFEKAAHLAALAAPYRHPRLSAVCRLSLG